tara:strand:+ start:476 stop:1354 length:879 start_codon:yes stop_codon:yes gene_type:complete
MKKNTKKLKSFFSDFYKLLELGFPIVSSLEHLAAKEENEDFAKIINSIKSQIEEGSLLSKALAENPKIFNKKMVKFIQYSERKGTLTQTLKDISNGYVGNFVERNLKKIFKLGKLDYAILFFLIIGFLPVLPFENKDGKLYVGGFESNNKNFYSFKYLENLGEYKVNNSFEPTDNFNNEFITILDTKKYSSFLKSKNLKDEIVKCIVKRDFFLVSLSTQVNTTRELIRLTASPVPFIWIARLITNYILLEISFPEFPPSNELIEKLSKNCDDSRFITAPKNLLDFKVLQPFE